MTLSAAEASDAGSAARIDPLEGAPPDLLAVVIELVGRLKSGSSGHGTRRVVVRPDVGDDRPCPATVKPENEGPDSFDREAAALPRNADQPGNVGHTPAIHDRGLDEADGGAVRPAPNDPVVPFLGAVSGLAGTLPRVRGPERFAIWRPATDERVETRIGQYSDHLVGVGRPQRNKVQSRCGNDGGRHGRGAMG